MPELPLTYKALCALRCEWCAKGSVRHSPGVGLVHYHSDAVVGHAYTPCTAPTAEAACAEAAQQLANARSAKPQLHYRQINRLRAGIHNLDQRLTSMAAERDAALAELAALKEYKADLDWWDSIHGLDFGRDDETGDRIVYRIDGSVNDHQWTEIGRGKTLRLAIRAARA